MKNILKFKKNNKVVETEEVKGTKEEVVMKPKMNLKKKLMIGGGVVAGVVLGAAALINKGKQSTDVSDDDYEDEDEDDFDDIEVNSDDESNEVINED